MALNTHSLNESAFNELGIGSVLSFALHEVSYRSNAGVIQQHDAHYSSIIATLHTAAYHSEYPFLLHEATWGLEAQKLHQAIYASESATCAFALHTASYDAAPEAEPTYTLHIALYASLGGSEQVFTQHVALWASEGAQSAFQQHDVFYVSVGGSEQVFSLHETSWTVTPNIQQLHTVSWKSVIAAQQLHISKYETVVDNFALHTARYRSNDTTPFIQDGLIYVRV